MNLGVFKDITQGDESVVVLVTGKRILLFRPLKLKVLWDVPLSDLDSISYEPGGIQLLSRGGTTGPRINIPNDHNRVSRI